MKPFTAIAVAFLALITLVQLVRFLLGWEIIVNGIVIPVWLSGVAAIIAGVLSTMLWRESRR